MLATYRSIMAGRTSQESRFYELTTRAWTSQKKRTFDFFQNLRILASDFKQVSKEF